MPATILPPGAVRRDAGPRRAFTIIELLVVIAVIGVIAMLVLPAVQRIRESSRRNTCASNLKQVAAGVAGFESAMGAYPAGYTITATGGGNTGSTQPAWGWAVFILPYVDQQVLYDKLDPLTNTLKQVCDGTNKTLLQTALPIYRCASDQASALNTQCNFGSYSANTFPLATSNYVGSCGGWNTSGNNCIPTNASITSGTDADGNTTTGTNCCWLTRTVYCAPQATLVTSVNGTATTPTVTIADTGGMFIGAFGPRATPPGPGPVGLRASTILDGESETILLGERNLANYAAVWAGAGRGDSFINEGTARTLGRPMVRQGVIGAPENFWTASGSPENNAKYFSSAHNSGGVQFAFCDGSVRFLVDAWASTTVTGGANLLTSLTHRRDAGVVTNADVTY